MQKQQTTYDRCKYLHCNNGKHNGYHLFRFPSTQEKQLQWIENSGNVLLSNWACSSLRTTGLCCLHFKEEDFLDQGKTRLRRNSVPLHCRRLEEEKHVLPPQNGPNQPDPTEAQLQFQEQVHEEREQSEPVREHVHVNEMLQDTQSEKENNCINVTRSMPIVTYPSGKEMFSFSDTDHDLSFLNYEPPAKINVDSTTSDSAPIAQPFKKISKSLKHAKLCISKLKKQLLIEKSKVQQLQKIIKVQRNKNSRLNKRLQRSETKKFTGIDDYLKSKDIPDLAKTMIKLQLHKPNKPYTTDEKDLAKQFYFHSAACYSRLKNAGLVLPAESSVRSWVSEYDVVPGMRNDVILKKIGEYLKTLPPEQRLCALKFDEMSIKAAEEYSKKYDLIEGLVDMGKDCREPQIAKHAILFCVDSINAKRPWRQLLAFGFNEAGVSGDELLKIIPKIVTDLRKVGADVRLIVCDQGTNNRKLFTLLNISVNEPYFFVESVKIYATFDWPHLIKRLIAQLRAYNYIYVNDEIIISFEDLKQTWELDTSHGTSNLLGFLSETHFNPNSFEAMKVKLAFQLLSRRMACAIKLAGKDTQAGLSSKTWSASADFVETMNAVIDACNVLRLQNRDHLKRPLSDKNPEIQQRLESFIEWSEKWVIKKKGKNHKPPCLSGLPLTARALLSVYLDVKALFPQFELATGLCNQDSVEHVHSKLRGRGGFNANPTCRMYRLAFRHILSTDFIHTSKKGNTDCEESESLLMQNDVCEIENTLNENAELFTTPDYNSEEMNELEIISSAAEFVELHLELKSSDMSDINSKFTYERNAITYFSGYVARKALEKSNCEICQRDLMKDASESGNVNENYINFREYPHSDPEAQSVTYLIRPTERFAQIINCQLEAFDKIHSKFWHERELLLCLIENVEAYTRTKFPDWFDQENVCYEHRISMLKFLLTVKIFAQTRKNNHKRKNANPKSSVATKCKKLKNLKNL